MRDGDHLEAEGAKLELRADGHDLHRHLIVEARFLQLQRQYLRSKGRAVDGALKLRPQPGNGAEVILVGMGEHEAVQARFLGGDEAHVRQHHVDAGVRLLAKLHTEVDHQPVPVIGGT